MISVQPLKQLLLPLFQPHGVITVVTRAGNLQPLAIRSLLPRLGKHLGEVSRGGGGGGGGGKHLRMVWE